ncbi:MAG TPA: glycosyltransferase [Bauldia sp.]|nr:glycosyltransferase [Bauldia sp.]
MSVVSVAMPVFNGARFLGEAIESVLAQTHRDLELIISDDGSTDGSQEIARAYAASDARIVLVAGCHGGIAAAMNRALAVARGVYFAPMDQDDIALPDRLEKLASFLGGNEDIVLVGGGMRLIDEHGNGGRRKNRPLKPSDVAAAMRTSTAVIHPTSMMRTAAVRALGGYRSILPYAEDYDLWLRLMEHHQMANIADIVLLKRIHPAAVTQDSSQRAAQVVARAIAYLSHLSRVTFGEDIVHSGEPLVVSAARFIDTYLDQCDALAAPVRHNMSRFMRYAPLLTTGPRVVNRPYWRYVTKALRSGGVRHAPRTLWYLALYFGYHRWRQDELLKAFPALRDLGEAAAIAA